MSGEEIDSDANDSEDSRGNAPGSDGDGSVVPHDAIVGSAAISAVQDEGGRNGDKTCTYVHVHDRHL